MDDKGKGILGNWDATSEEIRQAMGHAIYMALREHKRAGIPAVTWDREHQRVVVVPPEEIVLPPEYDVEVGTIEARDGAQGEPIRTD
jgi:hypothetical protein